MPSSRTRRPPLVKAKTVRAMLAKTQSRAAWGGVRAEPVSQDKAAGDSSDSDHGGEDGPEIGPVCDTTHCEDMDYTGSWVAEVAVVHPVSQLVATHQRVLQGEVRRWLHRRPSTRPFV